MCSILCNVSNYLHILKLLKACNGVRAVSCAFTRDLNGEENPDGKFATCRSRHILQPSRARIRERKGHYERNWCSKASLFKSFPTMRDDKVIRKFSTSTEFSESQPAQLSANTPRLCESDGLSHAEEISDFTEDSFEDRVPLTQRDLASSFSLFQREIYDQLRISWLLPAHHLRKKQLKWNFHEQQIQAHISTKKFKNLCSYTEIHVNSLSVADSISILQSLDLLFFPEEHLLWKDLISRCCDSIESMNLNQLASLSSCLQTKPIDIVTLGRIVNACKLWLVTHSSEEVDLEDLCKVFENIGDLASVDLLHLAANSIIGKLQHDPSSITLHTFAKVCEFVELSKYECTECLVDAVLKFPVTSFHDVVINDSSLTFEVCAAIGRNPWLCSVLHRVRSYCISQWKHRATFTTQDLIWLMTFDYIPEEVQQDMVARTIRDSDNFLFFQLMSIHLQARLRNNQRRTILFAYCSRIERLIRQTNPSHLTELLSQNDGEWAQVLFSFLTKMTAQNVDLKPDLHQILENRLLLSTNSWDAAKLKIYHAGLHAMRMSEIDIPLSSPQYSMFIKLLSRLDFDDLMNFYHDLEDLKLQNCSDETQKEAAELKSRVQQMFEEKLSRIHTLTPALTTHKIWLSYPRQDDKKFGLFRSLRNSLPRFTCDHDDMNCLRALRILYWSAEKLPVYQEGTFENLLSYLMSHRELQLYPGIQLLKVMSYAGYHPRCGDAFSTWVDELVTELVDKNLCYRSMQLQLAVYLSMLGMFPDKLLLHIFSLDFMTMLDQELAVIAPHKQHNFKADLALLNRSMAIQCPHLSVPWFSYKFLPHSKDPAKFPTKRIVGSLQRVCNKPEAVLTNCQSPYLHHIDALICIDDKGVPGGREELDGENMCEKLAFLYLGEDQFCSGSAHLLGRSQTNIQELQMLGYTVIQLPYHELSSPHLKNQSRLDNFIREKINTSLGYELLPDFSVLE